LFDFGLGKKTGKPTGIDIKEKKTTLPLIYALNNSSGSQKSRIINIVKSNSKNDKKINEVMEFVFKSGGIEYSQKLMEQYTNEALAILDEFEDSEAKTSLKQLIKFTIEREK
jgi:octaprenyl-diphosphate synthase